MKIILILISIIYLNLLNIVCLAKETKQDETKRHKTIRYETKRNNAEQSRMGLTNSTE